MRVYLDEKTSVGNSLIIAIVAILYLTSPKRWREKFEHFIFSFLSYFEKDFSYFLDLFIIMR